LPFPAVKGKTVQCCAVRDWKRWVLAIGVALLGCGLGGPKPDRCRIDVSGLEEWNAQPERVDVAYRVSGEAGSAGKVWLAAKLGASSYVSGPALPVGPGPFQAIVDLALTGRPIAFVAVLEVAGKRCSKEVKPPG
jgi:hypothetical protein